MLNLLEKIAAGVSGLLVVATVVLYAWLGLPSPRSIGSFQPVRKVPVASAAPNTSSTTATPAAPVPPEIQKIATKLAEQTGRQVAPGQIQREGLQMERDLFEYLSNESNLLPALKTAKSRPMQTAKGTTRLQVYAIQAKSHLSQLGFQDNDVIELLEGEIVEFNDSSTMKYYELWGKAKEKLRNGGSISVTVTRGGRPVNLEYRLPR